MSIAPDPEKSKIESKILKRFQKKTESAEKSIDAEIQKDFDHKKEALNKTIEDLEKRLEEVKQNYIFDPVWWDNAALETLAAKIREQVGLGNVSEKEAKPHLLKIAAGQRTIFPGWRYSSDTEEPRGD